MQICSYLVYPVKGKLKTLKKRLLSLPGCEVLPAENKDVIILVTETKGKAEENKLQKSLKQINEIQCVALTFGSVDSFANKLDRIRKEVDK